MNMNRLKKLIFFGPAAVLVPALTLVPLASLGALTAMAFKVKGSAAWIWHAIIGLRAREPFREHKSPIPTHRAVSSLTVLPRTTRPP